MRPGITVCTILAALALMPASAARANPGTFTEFVVGFAEPQGDNGYEALVNTGLVLGARVGSTIAGRRKAGLALEVGLAWLPLNLEDLPLVDEGFSNRIRATGGARLFVTSGDIQFFGRFGVGIDYISVSGDVLGVDVSTDDLGLLFEPGGGVLVDIGSASLGVSVGVPVAMHDDDDNDGQFDLDYTSTDLEILLTVGGSL